MRVIAEWVQQDGAPLLRLYVHDAPHRRVHQRVIQDYRELLCRAVMATGQEVPVSHPIELAAVFVNPTSPDLGNLYLALERALDGKTMRRRRSVLTDDALVQVVRHLSKMYTGGSRA